MRGAANRAVGGGEVVDLVCDCVTNQASLFNYSGYSLLSTWVLYDGPQTCWID